VEINWSSLVGLARTPYWRDQGRYILVSIVVTSTELYRVELPNRRSWVHSFHRLGAMRQSKLRDADVSLKPQTIKSDIACAYSLTSTQARLQEVHHQQSLPLYLRPNVIITCIDYPPPHGVQKGGT
jgi:hypothetical protein